MKTCHVCNAVCEDNAELCHVCGADLATFEEEKTNEVKEITDPVLVATISDVVSAEIFGDILNDNGILFISDNEDEDQDGGMRVVFGGGFASTEIYVDNSDFEAAKELYEEFLKSETEFDGEFDFTEE